MLGNSAIVVVVRMRPRAIPLDKITMRKSTRGFPLSFPCMMSMGLRLAALCRSSAKNGVLFPPVISVSLTGPIVKVEVNYTLWAHFHLRLSMQ